MHFIGAVDILTHSASHSLSQVPKYKHCDAMTDFSLKYFDNTKPVASGYDFGPEELETCKVWRIASGPGGSDSFSGISRGSSSAIAEHTSSYLHF